MRKIAVLLIVSVLTGCAVVPTEAPADPARKLPAIGAYSANPFQRSRSALRFAHSSPVRKKSHSIGSDPSRARACVSALEATVRLPSGPGRASSSCSATSEIGQSRMTAIAITSHMVRSAGSLRRRTVAVPVE